LKALRPEPQPAALMRKMSRTYRLDALPRLKPRQIKRQRLQKLLEEDRPQPDLRPEPVQYKPLG
jgi:hypothetical protein